MSDPVIHTPPKSKRELRNVSGPKRQLIEVAQQLKYIDRVPLYGVDCREFDRCDGSTFVAVNVDAEFRAVWEQILEYMRLIGPVDVREETDGTDPEDVQFVALADGSQQSLTVAYCGDGSLSVRASYAYSPSTLMAEVVLNKTYSLD